MSEATGKYTIQIETKQTGSGAADAASSLKKIEEGAGKAAEKLDLAGREFRHILTQAGGGEMAELLRAASGPLIIGEAIVQTYKEIVKGMEAAHEQQLKLITDAETYREQQQKLADTIRNDLLDSLNQAAIHVAHLRDNYDAAAKAADLLDKHQTNIAAATEKAADAQERIALATIAEAEAIGRISGPEATAMRAQAELDAKKRKDAAENARDLQAANRKEGRAGEDEASGKHYRDLADAARAQGGPLEQLHEDIATTKSIIISLTRDHPSAVSSAKAAEAEYERRKNGGFLAGAQGEDINSYEARRAAWIAEAQQAATSAKNYAKNTDPSGQENHLKDLERQAAEMDAIVKKWDATADRELNTAQELRDAAAELRQAVAGRVPGQQSGYTADAEANRRLAAADFANQANKDFRRGTALGPERMYSPDQRAEIDLAQGHAMLDDIRNHRMVPIEAVQALLAHIAQLRGESSPAKDALDNLTSAFQANIGH